MPRDTTLCGTTLVEEMSGATEPRDMGITDGTGTEKGPIRDP